MKPLFLLTLAIIAIAAISVTTITISSSEAFSNYEEIEFTQEDCDEILDKIEEKRYDAAKKPMSNYAAMLAYIHHMMEEDCRGSPAMVAELKDTIWLSQHDDEISRQLSDDLRSATIYVERLMKDKDDEKWFDFLD